MSLLNMMNETAFLNVLGQMENGLACTPFAQTTHFKCFASIEHLIGFVILFLLVQILFIQIVLARRVMENSRYLLLFLFLTGSLFLPSLSGTFDRSDRSTHVETAQRSNDRRAGSDSVTEEATELRQLHQRPAQGARNQASAESGRPVPIQVVTPSLQPQGKPAARPVMTPSPVRTASSSGQVGRFTEVSQPHYASHRDQESNRSLPQPVTIRGNVMPQSRRTDPLPVNTERASPGHYTQSPVPLSESRRSSPPSKGTGSLIPQPLQSTHEPIKSAAFAIPQPKIPQLDAPSQYPQPQGNVNTFRYLLDYFAEALHQGVASAAPAVVHIEAQIYKESSLGKRREVEETGCGVLAWLERRFFVITNSHVAGRAVSNKSVRILLADQRTVHPIRILTCSEIDIALLELDPSSLPANILQGNGTVRVARFGNSDTVRVPDTVLTIGSPFGLSGSVSRGVISGRERRRIPLGGKPDQIQDFLQTDAAVNPGNSGGPLLNISGEVIGIVTAIATNSGGSEGVAFAQPINNVLHVARQLIVDGVYRRPYMGVELDPEFDSSVRARYGLHRAVGTRVVDVNPRSPADLAGLRSGDIILRYNGVEVQDDQHLVQLIGLSASGETPQISVLRNNAQILVSPQLITTSTAATER